MYYLNTIYKRFNTSILSLNAIIICLYHSTIKRFKTLKYCVLKMYYKLYTKQVHLFGR